MITLLISLWKRHDKPHWLKESEYKYLGGVAEVKPNGICRYANKRWYWSDETYTYSVGPYKTYEEAKNAQDEYSKTI